MLIDIIAGARPNFMKISPIIDALHVAQSNGGRLRYRLIHTGQHYDHSMSANLFNQLGIPDPDINLSVGSGTQAEQTGRIMVAYEHELLQKQCNMCLVVGDVTSTMACSIVARKLCIPVAHVEGGIRAFDLTMPEEINRIVTDSIANWFFTTSESANRNLRLSGVSDDRIFFVGNTMIDTLLKQMPKFCPPLFWHEFGLKTKQYLVLTLHRPSNVDNEQNLIRVLQVIASAAQGLQILFPVHPRTYKKLQPLDCQIPGLKCVPPLGYLEFNYLVKHAKGVITDSGGITEETTVMGVPCLTLRDNTERPETVNIGTNELIGTDPLKLVPALSRLMAGDWKKGSIPEKWDGNSALRIVAQLEQLLL
ncbi:MAG: UDP-N-acetylglucosamine 2-epimerase (non-hydrolyzing) [Chlorobiaceae bacterium]